MTYYVGEHLIVEHEDFGTIIEIEKIACISSGAQVAISGRILNGPYIGKFLTVDISVIRPTKIRFVS